MIDLHCHLDLYPDPKQIACGCVERDLYVLSVTTTPSAWPGTSALAHGKIRTALGLHPQLAEERKHELDLFDELLPQARYVGEIGLDGLPELKDYWPQQLVVFDHVLRSCSANGGRIMSIHSRRASSQVIDCLQSHPHSGIPVMHWFSGSQRDLARANELGCWFSVGPAMLMGKRGRSLVAKMPRNRILTESDGPFAQIEGRPAFPWDVEAAIARLSDLWDLPEPDVRQLLEQNMRSLIDADPAKQLQ